MPKTLYVSGFPENFDDAHLNHFFGKFGTVMKLERHTKGTIRFCTVLFDSEDSINKVLQSQPVTILGRYRLETFRLFHFN